MFTKVASNIVTRVAGAVLLLALYVVISARLFLLVLCVVVSAGLLLLVLGCCC